MKNITLRVFCIICHMFICYAICEASDQSYLFSCIVMEDDSAVSVALQTGGGDPNTANSNGETPLAYAVSRNTTSTLITSILIEDGANVNDFSEDTLSTHTTPLLLAVGKNKYNFVELLLSSGAQTSLCGNYSVCQNICPLFLAATDYVTSESILSTIVDYSQNLDIRSSYHDLQNADIMSVAVATGKTTATLQMLLNHGLTTSTLCESALGTSTTLLMLAARNNNVGQMRFLMTKGCSNNSTTSLGLNVADVARVCGAMDVCDYLISIESNVSERNKMLAYRTGYYAASGNIDGLVSYLNENDITSSTMINTRDALIGSAILGGKYDAIRVVFDKGVSTNTLIVDNQFTPLTLAAVTDSTVTLQMLINSGADKNQTDSQGYTAMTNAASVGSGASVHYLINVGANVQTRAQVTTETLQAIQSYPDIYQELENHGF